MANSKITIVFNAWLDVPEYIQFQTGYTDVPGNPTFYEEWVNFRSNASQVSRGDDILQKILDTVTNFAEAFDLDYNSAGAFNISQTSTSVVIESTVPGIQFFNVINSHPSSVITVENTPLANVFGFQQVVLSAGSDCNNINISVQANEIIALLAANGTSITPNGTDTVAFDWPRGSTVTLYAENAGGDIAIQTETLPLILKVTTMQIALVETPNGANATVSINKNTENTLEYSLDDSVYQPTGLFTNLAVGSYTAYIRDQYGCKVQKDFDITAFEGNTTELTPEFTWPKVNSFRMKKEEVWDNQTIYKNDENTLSFEEEFDAVFKCYKQKFQSGDTIRSQYRTNYSNVAITLHDGTSETVVTPSQMTTNLQRQDKRDGNVYPIDTEHIGVYYTEGETYDYVSGVANGTFALNGNLPAYGQIGLWVYVGSFGWLQIKDIIRDENDTAWVLKFAYPNTTPAPSVELISTVYNARNFEVFEFEVDFSSFVDKQVQLKIVATNTDWDTVTMLSEIIDVKLRHEDTVALSYKHSQNTSTMNYSFGIRNLLRVDGKVAKYSPDGEKEISRGDSKTSPIKVNLYDDFELMVYAEPTAMAKKVAMAVSHDDLLINGVSYTNKETPEAEQLGPESNLYELTVKITKTGGVFSEDYTPSVTQSELIGLLEDNGDYIKIN